MNVFDYLFDTTQSLEKDFVLGPKETISFKKLHENSLKVASYLKVHVGEDQNIALVSPNSVFFITVYLGILKSGNVCVPLNFTIEQENLDFILETTACQTVFMSKNQQSKQLIGNGILHLDEVILQEILEHQKIEKLPTDCSGNKLAEIIFTSGSTGSPKGVMISHHNIIANTGSIIEYLNLTGYDIIAVVLPFFYCYGLSLLHTHLRVGGSMVLNNSFIFLGSVINDLKKYKCTGFAGVPSHYQILLKKSQNFKTTHFPDLRYVTQAGGKLHNVFVDEFTQAFPEIDFFIMYGQTEATARLSYLPPNMVSKKVGSIGKGIPGVSLKIVDNQGDEVKVGEEGELVAKGENIMLGYFKEPVETEKTIKNGWLYTGDIAVADKENFLYLKARKKEIIKVGGKRVSPKEIEEVILSVPEVVDCTITGVEDDILGESILATIVLNNPKNQIHMKEVILSKCVEKLSLYKIPQQMVFENSISISATGKKIKK
ncbi:Long-chain-fatty-acid--CoA ligase [Arenibacter antarcticus]|uniref:Class I adenylate-forming enzyme family protein n=1 Tax=Arenibacter antarcticus TaxID=2040469 RepID=A0ABW5VH11_9FLAO|nr:AMP-binding protein [Arenibacter sp. H213]MCM4167320.1 AMP-dependent synthetase [Arenibacter sp. H213]